MRNFFDDDVFLSGDVARKLYAQVAELPIYDYHCHLDPREIYSNRRFDNIGELWLEADHYKWRVMRNFGVSENLVTGNADYKSKFMAFAKALPSFAGNPVYHWAQLELKKYFGITEPLCADNAEDIWNRTKDMMSDGSFCARELIVRSGVDTVVTTDDPLSDLAYHKLLKAEEKRFCVLPCFRPDKAINISAQDFAQYINALSEATGVEITGVNALMRALGMRLDYFIENGCTVADTSYENFPNSHFDIEKADVALQGRFAGKESVDEDSYRFAVIAELMKLFARKGIVAQIHTGVVRNQNTKRFEALGADSGIDSVGNALDIVAGARLFDCVERDCGLPRTIVYTLNPNSYYPLATMIGDFAGESKGKMQLGAGWWFMDHRDGIREQLKIFANTSGIGVFNGMLTDSRSFVSYARHDYFRRILCSVVGEWVDDGEYPLEFAKQLVEDISYFNAKTYFGGAK